MTVDKKTLRTIFLGTAGCIFLYWLLHETERVTSVLNHVTGIFMPFVVGAGIAFILNVPVRSFERMLVDIKKPGLRRGIAVILTFLFVVLVLSLVFWLLIPQIVETVESLIPKILAFVANVEKLVNEFLSNNPELMAWIAENTEFEKINWAALIEQALGVMGDSLSAIMGSAVSAIGSLAGAVVNLVISLVFALYCLFNKETLARQGRSIAYAFLPERWVDRIVRVLRLTNSTFSNFLSGQCLEVCILGLMFAVAMMIFRMPYVVLVSVLVAITAFIPVVGAFIGCIFGAFFILVNDPIQAIAFVVMFLILQQIENNMIYPRVVGTSIGLPGMWVLVAVAVGGEIMGVGGMFLMIPVSSVLYTLLREYTYKRLGEKEIDSEKLKPQPPELESHFKKQIQRHKEKRDLKRMLKEKLKLPQEQGKK